MLLNEISYTFAIHIPSLLFSFNNIQQLNCHKHWHWHTYLFKTQTLPLLRYE